MLDSNSQTLPGKSVDSTMTYLADRSVSPVWHNAFTTELPDRHEGNYGTYPVQVHDVRPVASDLSLDRNGFVLLRHQSAVKNLEDPDSLALAYNLEMEALIREVTGASLAISMGSSLRQASAATTSMQPLYRVHCDYTDTSGPLRARQLLTGEMERYARIHPPIPHDQADAIMGRRFAEYNIWRPINGPVRRDPFALIDSSSLAPEDAVPCIQDDNEIYVGAYNPAHRWYYAPEMENDEVLIFKCFDSARDGRSRLTLHSAFVDPNSPPDAVPRRNVEARVFAYFD